jgi:hypothetical protein
MRRFQVSLSSELPTVPAWRRYAPWIAVAISGAMMAYRFSRIDLSPFIMDEAYFVDGAGWALASPITGSVPVHYGPAPVWFYGVAQLFVGRSPVMNIAAMCLAMTLAQLFFVIAVARALKLPPLALALLLAFVAASPYQFFWSRLAWNQLSDACAFAAVALFVGKRPLTVLRMLAIGGLLGLALSSHPISAGFIAAMGLVIGFEHRRDLKQLAKLAAAGTGAVLAVNVPWFVDMILHPWPDLGPRPERPLGAILEDVGNRVLNEVRPASMDGLQYFFDTEWGRFVRTLGWPFPPETLAHWLFVALVVISAAALVAAMLAGSPEHRKLAALTACTVALSAVYFSHLQLAPHPHYDFPVSWVAAAAVALALSMSWKYRAAAIGVGAFVAALAIIQFDVILQWRGLIERENGMRNMHYSTPVGQLSKVVNEACSWPFQVNLRNQTLILAKPLEYLLKTEPLCAGKSVRLCGWNCPPTSPEARTFALRYDAPQGASVALVPE